MQNYANFNSKVINNKPKNKILKKYQDSIELKKHIKGT